MSVEAKNKAAKLTNIFYSLIRKDKFEYKIGAEIVLTNEGTTFQVSSFNPEILSQFVSNMMVLSSNQEIHCEFSTVNIEGLYSPTYTNIIKL